MQPTPTPVPLSPSTKQYWYQWAKRAKYAAFNPAHAIRLSSDGLAIEAKLPDAPHWQPIMLANNGTQFASQEDRQILFEMVTGAREIPEIKVEEASNV